MKELLASPQVKDALAFLQADQDQMLKDLLALVAIPAFSFHEKAKAEDMQRRFQELGLADVHMDEVWNVFGTLKGSKGTPKIMLAAHTDTVFPMKTDVTPKLKDGIYSCPGINDDTHGLADILSIIRAINKTGLKPVGDIIFCANVGEEGLGDLRGVKHIFGQPHNIDAFISLDTPTLGGIVHNGTGSFRYRFTFTARGGHSFADFGQPNPIHAMSRAMNIISDFQVPDSPKTTFNIGVVEGGSSINVIAQKASFLLDIRSNSQEELLRLEQEAKAAGETAVAKENARWHSDDQVKLQIEKIGNRPSGTQADDCLIVRIAQEALRAIGQTPELRDETSTDANIPISLGIPALSVGRGGKEGGVHTTNEWFDPTDAYLGPQKDLLMVLAMTGLEGVAAPRMPKHVQG